MEQDPLQQLRDVHLPVDPAWWPPAIGWWVLAIALVAALIWLVRQAVARHRAFAAVRSARLQMERLGSAARTGEISQSQYAHQANELLKRLLVRAHRQHYMASLAGQRWLQTLDTLSDSDDFTNGPGKILGDGRFARNVDFDLEAVHKQLMRLLTRIKPPHIQGVST